MLYALGECVVCMTPHRYIYGMFYDLADHIVKLCGGMLFLGWVMGADFICAFANLSIQILHVMPDLW